MQRKTRHIPALIVLATCYVVGFSLCHFAAAQDDALVQNLKSKISDHQDSLDQLNKEIEGIKSQLNDIGSQKKTLQNEVKSIDLVRTQLMKEAEVSAIKAQRANDQVNQLAQSIQSKQAIIDEHKKAIAFALQRIAEYDDKSLIETVLSDETLSKVFSEADQLEQVQQTLSSEIDKLKQTTQALGVDKSNQEQQYKQVAAYTQQLNAQKDIVDQKREERTQLIKETNNKESAFQSLLKEKERRRDEFQQELDNFQNQLKVAIDATSFPTPGTKALVMPIPGARVTQHFGYTSAAKYLYASGHHSGTDFAASIGTPIGSAGPGTVVAVGDTDIACRGASYGRYVFIRHTDGLATIYGHMSKITAVEGQKVEPGDIIGYSGKTGYATGPHLHFGVFVSSATKVADVPSQACPGAIFHMPVAPKEAYLDPENYL